MPKVTKKNKDVIVEGDEILNTEEDDLQEDEIEDEEEEKDDDDTPEEDTLTINVKPVEEKDVEVVIAVDFSVYLGHKWWEFKKGKTTVPPHIKELLKKRKALEAI